jgi:predicted nucleic acid-binding protein
MTYPPIALIDSGILVAYYSASDRHHPQVCTLFEHCTSQFVTTVSCITEVMWLLSANWQVQNQFLNGVIREVFQCSPLLPQDFLRIAELNVQHANVGADFVDLSLIAVSERLKIPAIVTLDADFEIYCRYRTQPFERIPLPVI